MKFTYFKDLYDKRVDNCEELSWTDVVKILTTHERTSDKYGKGFSPVSFAPTCDCDSIKCPGVRGHAIGRNVVEVYALAFDLDKSVDGGPLGQAEVVKQLKHLQSLGVQAIAHSTYSYDPKGESTWRLFLALSRPISRSEFKPVWSQALKYLGIPSGIKTDNPARFWHLPSCPVDGVAPVAFELKGAPLNVEKLLEGITVEELSVLDKIEHEYPAASEELLTAVRKELQDHGPANSGDNGNAHTFQAACIVANDFALNDGEAYEILLEWDKDNSPPWGDDIAKFIDRAQLYATGQRGSSRVLSEMFPAPTPPPPGSFAEARQQALADFTGALTVTSHVEITPLFMSAKELLAKQFPKTPWLVRGLLTKNGLAAIATDPKAGKTWAATEICIAVASGTKAFGEYDTEQGSVCYFYAEDEASSVKARIKSLCVGGGRAVPDNLYLEPRGRPIDIGSDDDVATLIASARRVPNLKLLVIDPLRDMHSSAEDSSDEMSVVMRRLRTISIILGCTVLFVHHASKASADNSTRRPGQRMRGSGAIHGSLDCGFYMSSTVTANEGEISNRVDIEIKGAKGAGALQLTLTIVDDPVSETAIRASWAVTKPGEDADDDAGVMEVIRAIGGASSRLEESPSEKDIHRAVGGARASVKAQIKAAENGSFICREFLGGLLRGWVLTNKGQEIYGRLTLGE